MFKLLRQTDRTVLREPRRVDPVQHAKDVEELAQFIAEMRFVRVCCDAYLHTQNWLKLTQLKRVVFNLRDKLPLQAMPSNQNE